MDFEFATATAIHFGCGLAARLGELAAPFGGRALLVTGAAPDRFPAVLDGITAAGIMITPLSVTGEPTTSTIEAGVIAAREAGAELVISLGGGSVIDAGKAIAALMTNPGEPLDYLEVVGRGLPLTVDPAPFVAVPTTAGTGAEVTRNAVLAVTERRVKVSLRSPRMLPRLAIVDPELTRTLPPKITADCGLDALTQVLEPFVSNRANPLTDALCRDGIRRGARSLRRAVADGEDLAARTDMALTSLFGGLALANAKLGAVHGFAGPLGGMFSAPHGAICARLLPEVVAANTQALAGRGGAAGEVVLARYREVAGLLCGDDRATIADGIAWLRRLVEDLEIADLGAYGVVVADLPAIVAKAARSSSMRGNPIALTEGELTGILAVAL